MKDIVNKWSRAGKNRSLGLFFIRFATGLVFLMHGWMKIHNVGGVESMMMGFGLSGGWGVFISWLEVIGGAALILGVFSRLFAALFFIEMVFAVFLTSLGRSFSYPQHETEILLALVSLGIAFAGSGRYSLRAAECHHCGGMACKGECASQKM